MWQLLSVLFFLVLFAGCESATHVDIDAVIAEKVEERLTEFEAIINRRCLDRALEEAGLLADSIIIEQARRKKDTLDRPLKPLRPDQPELLELKDSLELAPLFDTVTKKRITQ
ncbi:hypothetical protein [Lewinella cohaerens]|uniref:hypothetical protein n=1 Tax=Lewinella cohaerens TaxID=70995 RepID=UPI0003820AAF|nr:hypothetical protein [Lewinella cohaerens]